MTGNRARYTIFIALLNLLLIYPCINEISAQNMEFKVYTSKQDSSLKIGYPAGWRVQEGRMGVVIQERQTNKSAGMLVLFGRLREGIISNAELAEAMINGLRQNTHQDLKIVDQQVHPDAESIFTIDASFTKNSVPMQAHAWSLADSQKNLAVFAFFYAPVSRFKGFKPQVMLYSALSPLLGLEEMKSADSDGANRDILYIRQEGGNNILCALNPASGKITQLRNFENLPVVQPTRSIDGSVLILAIPRMKGVLILQGIEAYVPELPSASDAFPLVFPLKEGNYTYSPSISRDNNLFAIRTVFYQEAENADGQESPLDDGNYNFVVAHSRGKLSSYKVDKEIQQHIAYHEDPQVPKVYTYRQAWFPAFSPVENLLLYIDKGVFIFVESDTGKVLRRITPDIPIHEKSGFSFSPDGKRLAYFSATRSDPVDGSKLPASIAILDIESKASKEFPLADNIHPTSKTSAISVATIVPDFSPDGKLIVFGAELREGESGVIDKQITMCDILILDLETGKTRQMTTDGSSFDPVWKGR